MTTSLPSKKINIGERLKTVAETAAVRLSCEDNEKPLYVIDVGTDHAKLPMYLVSERGFLHVTATDINEGPCKTARENIKAAGAFFEERIDVIRTNGLCGLEHLYPNRVIIAGMGGELIRDILFASDFVRKEKEKIKFVLQPQSKEHLLRKYLYENGYRILEEKRCCDSGKYYCVISAVYDGEKREADLLTLYFGKDGLDFPDALFDTCFEKKYRILEKNILARKGNSYSNGVYDEEEELFGQMKEYITKRGERVK